MIFIKNSLNFVLLRIIKACNLHRFLQLYIKVFFRITQHGTLSIFYDLSSSLDFHFLLKWYRITLFTQPWDVANMIIKKSLEGQAKVRIITVKLGYNELYGTANICSL
jgi:hypothetical protein